MHQAMVLAALTMTLLIPALITLAALSPWASRTASRRSWPGASD